MTKKIQNKRNSKRSRSGNYVSVYDYELWNLDYTIAQFVLPRLKKFKNITIGYPNVLTEKEWHIKLNYMIEAFKEIVNEYNGKEVNENKISRGLGLFAQYFRSLWD